jgi:type IV secretion system protein VirB5
MNEYAANDSGLKSLPGQGAAARTVEISSILQKSEGSYQVRWVETVYSNGVRRSREDYTGLFQVKLMPPRDEADTFKNPIGVYITNFTWSREFSGRVLRDDGAGATPAHSATPGTTNTPSEQGAMP